MVTEGRPHYFTKRDENQGKITKELQQLGFQIFDISPLPDRECPGDILVYGWHGILRRWMWQSFEVKTRSGKLTPQQREFQEQHPDALPTARTAEDVVEWYSREV